MIDNENGPAGGDERSGDDEVVYDIEIDDGLDVSPEEALQEAVEAVEARERREAAAAEPHGESPTDPQNGALAALEREVEELRDRSVRTLADFENYRRRVEREREEQRRFASSEALAAFLEVVDNLERALGAEGSEVDLRLGVKMIHKQMLELLGQFGVEAVPADGEVFDPAVHEAVAREEDPSVAAPTVREELQRGYRMYDRLLRPARVRVAVPPRRAEGAEGSDDESESDASASTDGAAS